MGAFFLYKKGTSCDLPAVSDLFKRKGFEPPKIFNLNNYVLWLFQKQLVNDPNYYFEDTSAVFCVGTVVYRSLSYLPSLKAILADFKNNVLTLNELIGNYGLIFFHNNQITLLTDPLNVQHIFMDHEMDRISSSFLAMVSSFNGKVNLNRMAFYEKIMTGYIIGPDTLISQVIQLTTSIKKTTTHPEIKFISNDMLRNQIKMHSSGIEDSLNCQVNILRNYFDEIKALCDEYSTDLGLSSGYDSRLVYALTASLSKEVSIHTHATEGVHETELRIVRLLVSRRGNPLIVIPTKAAWNYSENEMESLLVDTMLFFDGRCGYDMGAFSQVYTRAYKRCATGESKVTLTGLGGEMYRNHSHSALPYTYFPEWLKAHIYYSSALFAMKDRRLHAQLSNTIINKINARLDQDYGGWVDHLALRRYYSELRMPESNGVNHNAHNQLSFYLTPFIEKEIISEAYQATPYLGFSGTYEASLIEKISPDLAAEQSHYGFPLTHEPFSYKARCFIRGIIPDAISNYRYFFDRKYRNRGALNLQRYLTAVSRCGYLRSVNELLNRSFPEIDWDELVRDNLASPTVTHVGTFLLEYQHKIIFNQEI